MKNNCDLKQGRTLYREQTFNDVLQMLSTGVVSFNAMMSEPKKAQWTPMLKFGSFPSFLSNKLMLAATGYSYDSLFNHWYVKDGERSFGPFSLLQMLEFFQQQRLHVDNLVRHSSFANWQPFAQSGPFAEGGLVSLVNCSDIHSIITRRRHPRISYTNEVFVSSRAELYRGVTWSLSCQGLGMVTDESTQIQLDHRVNIIVNANNEHGAVQVKGRVVNIKKEVNYERVAIEFDEENDFLNQYIQQRVPKL